SAGADEPVGLVLRTDAQPSPVARTLIDALREIARTRLRDVQASRAPRAARAAARGAATARRAARPGARALAGRASGRERRVAALAGRA
ncbi:hypothetical protein SB778_41175, partial [Paraburkholderia sp. SIMBA_050]